ncbi:AI-2E family transporter [Granulicoccus phenolivorans]|uniref:AI-2E family transporter n=1 Tax=Granulicoccus phenolivorans TaxID=266854 RepID=UPI00041886B7|nr:AI-2E family transporter [Granulicoccus phenolivorans]
MSNRSEEAAPRPGEEGSREPTRAERIAAGPASASDSAAVADETSAESTPVVGEAAPSASSGTGPVPEAAPAATEPAGRPSLLARLRRITKRPDRHPDRLPDPEMTAAPAPADGTEQAPPTPDRGIPTRLLQMSPFAIGFTGALGVILAVALADMATQVKNILIVVVFSLFLALGLNPIVEWLVRRGVKRGLALILVILVGLGVLVLAGWAIVPVFVDQITRLVTNAPAFLSSFRSSDTFARLDAQYKIIDSLTGLLSPDAVLNNVYGGFVVVANAVVSIVLTVVLTLYFLASLPQIKNVIYRLAPASSRPRAKYLADEMFERIGGYLSGMFVVVTLSGTCSFIFMMILGLGQYALALAVMVAMFAFIPLVGTNISMVLVALVALANLGPTQAIITVVYFLVYQQFEAYFVQPNVMKRSVEVPGAVVIVAAVIGGLLFGIVGALLAIPTAASLLLLYREVLIPKLDRS